MIAEQYPIDQSEQAQRRLKYWRALGYESARALVVQMALSGPSITAAGTRRDLSDRSRRRKPAGRSRRSTNFEPTSARLIELPSGTMEVASAPSDGSPRRRRAALRPQPQHPSS